MSRSWDTNEFEALSWHDNAIHAFRIVEGDHGAGDLILDIDYIDEWLKLADGFKFRLQPATFRFFGVTRLNIAIDYAAMSIALGPMSIHGIQRTTEQRDRYVAQLWCISLNSPEGEIKFEATGFEQMARGESIVSQQQHLRSSERTYA